MAKPMSKVKRMVGAQRTAFNLAKSMEKDLHRYQNGFWSYLDKMEKIADRLQAASILADELVEEAAAELAEKEGK